MENFLLPHMPVCSIYMCCMFITQRVESAWKILRTRLKKGNGRLGKLAIDTLDSSMMKKTAADSKAKGKKPGSTHGLLGLIAVRERMLEFYSD